MHIVIPNCTRFVCVGMIYNVVIYLPNVIYFFLILKTNMHNLLLILTNVLIYMYRRKCGYGLVSLPILCLNV